MQEYRRRHHHLHRRTILNLVTGGRESLVPYGPWLAGWLAVR